MQKMVIRGCGVMVKLSFQMTGGGVGAVVGAVVDRELVAYDQLRECVDMFPIEDSLFKPHHLITQLNHKVKTSSDQPQTWTSHLQTD